MNKSIKCSIVAVIMVMVFLCSGITVFADDPGFEPDKNSYTQLTLGKPVNMESTSIGYTYSFRAPYSMTYTIDCERVQHFTNSPIEYEIKVYDKDLNPLSEGMDHLKVILKHNDKIYFTVSRSVDDGIRGVRVSVNLDLTCTVKADGKTINPGHIWYEDYDSPHYRLGKCSIVSVEISSLPSNLKIEWYIKRGDDAPSHIDDYTLIKGENSSSITLHEDKEFSLTMVAYDEDDVINVIYLTNGFLFENEIYSPLVQIEGDPVQIKAAKNFDERVIDPVKYSVKGDSLAYYCLKSIYGEQPVFDYNNPIKIPYEYKAIMIDQRLLFWCSICSVRVYYFVINDSEITEIKEGQTQKLIAYTQMGQLQKIYSFVPESSGKYTFNSLNLQRGNPFVGVFDSDLNPITFNDNISEYRNGSFSDLLTKSDFNCSVTVDLTAGQTYYFAVPIANAECPEEKSFDLVCDFKITYTPDEKPTPVVPTSSEPVSINIYNSGTFEDFVERLYTVALNRASEPEGKAFWCEHVGNGDLNGAQCANEFLLSKEFNDRKLSDEDFLKVLYKTFFDRDADDDPDGFNFWMNSLKTEGRDKVVDGFINSTEWCNVCAAYGVKSGATRAKATIASKNATEFATRLYTECLGRDPETDGLKFWSLGLTNLEVSGYEAAKQFFESAEFKGFNTSDEDYLRRLYTTFMGREADTDGLNYWLKVMSEGMSREQVLNEFAKSKEFTEICNTYAINRGI